MCNTPCSSMTAGATRAAHGVLRRRTEFFDLRTTPQIGRTSVDDVYECGHAGEDQHSMEVAPATSHRGHHNSQGSVQRRQTEATPRRWTRHGGTRAARRWPGLIFVNRRSAFQYRILLQISKTGGMMKLRSMLAGFATA